MVAGIGPGGMEIGYRLHPAHTGRDHITETAATLATEALRIGACRVQIVHNRADVRSRAAARRLGCTEVARRPPQEPPTSGEAGEDVVRRLLAPC